MISFSFEGYYVNLQFGFTLNTASLVNIETWMDSEEEKERNEIFNATSWFPTKDFECEFCGDLANFKNAHFQLGFSFDLSDADRTRILCKNCSED